MPDASRQPESPVERLGFHFAPLADSLANIKPPSWLVRGLLERDSLAMLFGDPGAGKSFGAVDLAACVATGQKWHGRKVYPGPVLFVAGEGRSGIARRFQAWSIVHDGPIAWAPLFLSSSAVSLSDWPSVAEVLEAAREVADICGKAPVLIVVDTVARNFGPGDENSTADMTAFIRGCDELRQEFGACVLLVHHSGHGDKSRARGAMALKGALDFEFRFARDESGVIRFEATKVKDHEAPEPMAFKLASVELGITDDQGLPSPPPCCVRCPGSRQRRPARLAAANTRLRPCGSCGTCWRPAAVAWWHRATIPQRPASPRANGAPLASSKAWTGAGSRR